MRSNTSFIKASPSYPSSVRPPSWPVRRGGWGWCCMEGLAPSRAASSPPAGELASVAAVTGEVEDRTVPIGWTHFSSRPQSDSHPPVPMPIDRSGNVTEVATELRRKSCDLEGSTRVDSRSALYSPVCPITATPPRTPSTRRATDLSARSAGSSQPTSAIANAQPSAPPRPATPSTSASPRPRSHGSCASPRSASRACWRSGLATLTASCLGVALFTPAASAAKTVTYAQAVEEVKRWDRRNPNTTVRSRDCNRLTRTRFRCRMVWTYRDAPSIGRGWLTVYRGGDGKIATDFEFDELEVR